MIRASLDLGTNTCLLLVADWPKGTPEPVRVLHDVSTVVRLGEGVDRNRAFAPQAMERTLKCLRGYAEKLRELGGSPAEAVCVATSQGRDASNAREFFERVLRETGFRFEVISGDEEARLTFLGGLLPGMAAERSAVIDIGGGSTELISLQGGKSVDVGAVRYTERFLRSNPVTDGEFWACQAAIDDGLHALLPWRKKLPHNISLVGVAGTAATLGAVFLQLPAFDPAAIDKVVLTRGDIHRLVEDLKWRTVEERAKLSGMEPGRADVILAGSLILWRAMEVLGFADCAISTRGLRYGVLR